MTNSSSRGPVPFIDDTFAKVIMEGWFSRSTPDFQQQHSPGRSIDDGDKSDDRSILDRLFETNPEFFSDEPLEPARDIDRGVDR